MARMHPTLKEIRRYFKINFSRLDSGYKELKAQKMYPVEISARLRELQHTDAA